MLNNIQCTYQQTYTGRRERDREEREKGRRERKKRDRKRETNT